MGKDQYKFIVYVDGKKIGVLYESIKKDRKEINRLRGLCGVELRRELIAQ